MLVLILGLLLFLGPHSSRMLVPGLRERLIGEKGEGVWKGPYALLSLIGIGLIIWGWILYRPAAPGIYEPPAWGRHVNSLFIWLALVLFLAPVANPGRIVAFIKHPMLTGTFLWAVGHLLANGDLASILLFGSFALYAAFDRISVATRGQPAPVFKSYRPDIIALAVGTALFLLLYYWAHNFMFGVSP